MGLTHSLIVFLIWTLSDSGYPPYNIRKLNEVQYVIEVLSWFSKDDIEVEVTDGKLVIRSTEDKEGESKNDSFVHKGIQTPLSRSFTLSDDIIVKGGPQGWYVKY